MIIITNLLAMEFGSTWWIWLILTAVTSVIAFKSLFSGWRKISRSILEDEDENPVEGLFKGYKNYFFFLILAGVFGALTVISVIFRVVMMIKENNG